MVKNADCHSDVETAVDSQGRAYHQAYHHRYRSQPWSRFMRWIDEQIEKSSRRRSTRYRRHTPDNASFSEFDRIPDWESCSLDWFDCSEFNDLPLSERALFRFYPWIALPQDWESRLHARDRAWMRVTDTAFMDDYGGNDRLTQYDIPNEDELANVPMEDDPEEDDQFDNAYYDVEEY